MNGFSTHLNNQIESTKRKIEVLDSRIGRLMSQRVDMEDRLAALYEKRNSAAGK